ncbi:MAG: hypothetical protein V4533_04970 [Pseudomonadota bacterium]|jgi:hypothetical protein
MSSATAPAREAVRAIYDAVYPGEEWTPVPFDEAERFETVHYRNAVTAARGTTASCRLDFQRVLIASRVYSQSVLNCSDPG